MRRESNLSPLDPALGCSFLLFILGRLELRDFVWRRHRQSFTAVESDEILFFSCGGDSDFEDFELVAATIESTDNFQMLYAW